jgi:hypothetical protein
MMSACAADYEAAGATVERIAGTQGRGDHLRIMSAWGGDGPGILRAPRGLSRGVNDSPRKVTGVRTPSSDGPSTKATPPSRSACKQAWSRGGGADAHPTASASVARARAGTGGVPR